MDTQLYTICVNLPGCLPEQDPITVVGLDAAREAATEELAGVNSIAETGIAERAEIDEAIGERGGVVGPLPDGYVIDVQPVPFDVDAFIGGYIECALWADCQPVPICAECREPVMERAGKCRHVWEAPYDHPAEFDYVDDEMGGGEHLILRPGARDKMAADCLDFVCLVIEDLLAYTKAGLCPGQNESYAGHDFWLTRNRHGAGFWDRGLGDLGERLTSAAHIFGSADDHTPYDCGDGTADA